MSHPPADAAPSTEEVLPWHAALADRIAFHAEQSAGQAVAATDLPSTLAALHARFTTPGAGASALHNFLHACLHLLTQSAANDPELAPIRSDIAVLCDLARTALASDLDDRPLLQHAATLADLPGKRGFAVRVPGRVVWLAAMAARLPGEEAAAAAMLADDLAAVDAGLPLQALRAAAAGSVPPRGNADAADR